ncbi:DNA helicase MCM9 [Nematocida minor]|uniref:DNA helicase MCM9 n=1 Tax=Nematocida minor TaxID=1912983 RepID=UPI0022204C5F|nr:DNA helicase MCM9 [Nematocida minor]KAI5191438.1 DNA helicase MCM9 [Nematocida minor]
MEGKKNSCGTKIEENGGKTKDTERENSVNPAQWGVVDGDKSNPDGCVDIMKAYNECPESAMRILASACAENTRVFNIPVAYDLKSYPRSIHYNELVSVYGTVMKLGLLKFKTVNNKKTDYQEIKIQERSNIYLPRTINVQLYNKLINTCKPGEVIRATGVVEVLWHRIKPGCPIECEYFIRAIEISHQKQKNNAKLVEVPLNEYDLLMKIVKNYAPSLAGLKQTKLAMILCTIGGQENILKESANKDEESANTSRDGSTMTEQLYQETQSRNRISSHILLVGKTGTGKSTLLAFASKTVAPAVRTTGSSCTSAGLTACAVRENGDWIIEPGAIPQADRGLCCIDDFNDLRKEEKASILEAMEQQTITIAKAGILVKLDTRCTVIAAGRHSTETEGALKSLKIPPPLLSRFDLIMCLDGLLASDKEIAVNNIEKQPEEKSTIFIRDLIEERKKIRVKLSSECKRVIEEYYKRQKETDNVSIRALESHIRICESYAKLLGKEVATEREGLFTALLLNSSLNTKSIWSYTLDTVLGSEDLLNSALDHIKEDLFGK